MEFKVGDIVSFGGLDGEVVHDKYSPLYPIKVNFPFMEGFNIFTLDGRLHTNQTEPLLKLVSRPKKEVEKTIEVFANVYPHSLHLAVSEKGAKGKEFSDCLNKTNKKIKIIYFED